MTLTPETRQRLIEGMAAAFENRVGTTHGVGDGMRAALDAILTDPDLTLVEGATVEWVVRATDRGSWREHRHVGPWTATNHENGDAT